jgi:hypothetical protein
MEVDPSRYEKPYFRLTQALQLLAFPDLTVVVIEF